RVVRREPHEVEALALGDRRQNRPYGLSVPIRERLDGGQCLSDSLKELALRRLSLQRRARARQRGWISAGRAGIGRGQRGEVAQAFGTPPEPRVGNGVACTSQQI